MKTALPVLDSIQGQKRRFSSRLLKWFDRHRRNYPWRRSSEPYRVFIAEFMLQRTGASQTVPVYLAFTRKLPTLMRAAAASNRALAQLLSPLGRLGRLRQLRQALDIIDERFSGRIPDREELLLQIPGVGLYTARAVLVFAFGKPYGLFDPNIARVIGRVFDIHSKRRRAHTDPQMWEAVDHLAPRRRPKEFNWALLDFASLICSPRNPKCGECPMVSFCLYYQQLRNAA